MVLWLSHKEGINPMKREAINELVEAIDKLEDAINGKGERLNDDQLDEMRKQVQRLRQLRLDN